ncbi:MAG: M81 family metallopeptidase [Acetobacteraceae bacterium]|nr:M81 family metallopeptidase [Acetobacteraceae bacterium]
MARVLIAECMQEVSSFNPLPSQYENFRIEEGEELLSQRGLNTAIGGALAVFAASGVEVVPAFSARAGSAGLLAADAWARLRAQFVAAVERCAANVDGVYLSLHGAMGAEGDLDPEATLIEAVRAIVGPRVPIVISLDLHGIATRRMLREVDGFALYWTYPHVDFADTGERAARSLLRLLSGTPSPAIVRVVIPALVRGDELITKTGCYGDLLLECRRLEAEGKAVAAGIMIGNPFTDVPELCSQVLIATDAPDEASAIAVALAERFWALRHRMQAKLVSVEDAIAQARALRGPVVFTDAADATSSGATGDFERDRPRPRREGVPRKGAGADRRSSRRRARPSCRRGRDDPHHPRRRS